ncbi:MAG: integrase [Desulfobacterales bacterium]
MSILSECPSCKTRQSLKNKRCKCGQDLDRAKRSGRVRYWITYRLPDGKQRRELVGTSLDDARAADGKRRAQKKEGRIFDMLPESRMTFRELAGWYLGLEKVKALSSYWLIELTLEKFNAVFGDRVVADVKLADLENYQARRLAEGKAPATVDHEIKKTKTMITAAFDNDKVGADVMRIFKRVKPTLKRGSDVRTRILSSPEYEAIMANLPRHMKPVFAMGYYAGMRKSEILGLTWGKVDLKNRLIRLEAADTKDREPRTIPISGALYETLKAVPRAIHDDHVFQYKGKPFTDIRASLKQACKAAGVAYGRFVKDGFIFHDLRHTFNTNMRKAGVAESVIMAITGHSTRAMFDRYNTIDLDDTQQAVDRLQAYLGKCCQSVDQAATDNGK